MNLMFELNKVSILFPEERFDFDAILMIILLSQMTVLLAIRCQPFHMHKKALIRALRIIRFFWTNNFLSESIQS